MKIRKKGVRGEGLLKRGKRVSSLWSQINYRIEVISWTALLNYVCIRRRHRYDAGFGFQTSKMQRICKARYHLSFQKMVGLPKKKTGNMFINHQNNKEPINVIMRYINLKKTQPVHTTFVTGGSFFGPGPLRWRCKNNRPCFLLAYVLDINNKGTTMN